MSTVVGYSIWGGGDGPQTFVLLLITIPAIAAYISILRKAGYSGWLVLLALIPLVNVVMFFVFAFSRWPIENELSNTKRAYEIYKANRSRAEVGR